MWITPKLDWTRTEYYNFEDLNRVENNSEVVAGLVGYFIGLPPLSFLTDRSMKRIEFADSLNRIEGNQDVLRQRFTPSGWLHRLANADAQKVPKKVDGAFEDVRLLDNGMYMEFNGNELVVSDKRLPQISLSKDYIVEMDFMYYGDGNYTLFSSGMGSDDRHGCQLEDGILKYSYYSPSTGYRRASMTFNNHRKGEWIHVKCMNIDGVPKLYVDGFEATGTLQPYLYPVNGELVLGANGIAVHGRDNRLNGRIKSVTVTDKLGVKVLDWVVDETGIIDQSGNAIGVTSGSKFNIYHDYTPSKTVNFAPINLSSLDQYESSRIEWEADTPEGTRADVEYSFDEESWTAIQSGQTLPFRKGEWLTGKLLFLRQRLFTNDQSITPAIRNFRYEINGYQTKVEWKANDPFDFNDALRLEHNLNLLYEHYKGNAEAVPICGAFICGEEVI